MVIAFGRLVSGLNKRIMTTKNITGLHEFWFPKASVLVANLCMKIHSDKEVNSGGQCRLSGTELASKKIYCSCYCNYFQ